MFALKDSKFFLDENLVVLERSTVQNWNIFKGATVIDLSVIRKDQRLEIFVRHYVKGIFLLACSQCVVSAFYSGQYSSKSANAV